MAEMIARHAFTTDEWHRMGDAGLFDEDARVELLDGEIIDMAPIGSRHAGTVNRLTRLLIGAVGERAVVAVQNPVFLDKHSEPQPDLAVLAPRPDDYTVSHAEPGEIMLLVEVADSSLAYDRDRKAAYYAGVGVPQCWIIDLTTETVLDFRSPRPAGYEVVDRLVPRDALTIGALAGVSVAVSGIFGA
jgi:Uma2 family endonuclease